MIYFIAQGGYVKIGYSRDNERFGMRFRALQCATPYELTILGTMKHGGPRTERALHELLGAWRHRNEWFDRSAAPVQHTIRAALRPGAVPPDVIEACRLAVNRSEAFRKRKHGAPRRGTIGRDLHPTGQRADKCD